MEKFKTLLWILLALVTVVGTAFTVDHRYAKEAAVIQVSERLDLKIIGDLINQLRQEIFQIEDRAYAQMRELTRDERRQIEEKTLELQELEERRRLIRGK